MKCPRCSHLCEADSSFCGKCGSSLLNPEETPTQDLLNNQDEQILTFTPGDSFGQRYRILEELGKGGMGRVYKAEDKELGIEVALKIIHPEFLSNVRMISRFKKEILLAREITHEHVVRIYDFGEIGGVKFITMQYIEGKNLKELIQETGQVSVQETIRIFQQVCAGLISAHKKEIVHRDLKPQNVMIDTNGKVFLTDFGLAKSIEGEELSVSGTVIGTPEYISPEQACGEKPDMRSDIYTLGIILFEMLTGQRPYQAKTALAYIQKHLHENPPPPSKYNPAIPRFLERVILKCMAKDMNKRFQSVERLMAEMQEQQNLKKPLISGYKMGKIARAIYITLAVIIVGGGLFFLIRGRRFSIEKIDNNQPRSMAIVDFNNPTGNQKLDHWCKAIQVLLTHDLYQSKYLRVLPEGQAYQVMKELNLPQDELKSPKVLRQIAEKLRVNYILRGSFTGSGNRFTVIVNIWNVKTQEPMSSVSAEGRGRESLNSIIDRLTKKLKLRLNISQFDISQDIDNEVGKISTQSPKALEDYVQGKIYYNKVMYPEAIEFFDRAIKEDPQFAMAYRTTSWAYARMGNTAKRKEYLLKTMKLKDRLTQREQYLVEGDVYGESWSTYSKSLSAYHELLKIYPDDYDGNHQLATAYLFMEEFDKAIEYYERCRQNMDRSVQTYTMLSFAYMAKGRYDQARSILQEYRKTFSDHDSIYRYLCRSYLYEGKFELALQQLANVKDKQAEDFKMLKGTIFYLKGQYNDAEDIFETICQNEGDTVSQINELMLLNGIYLERGQWRKAIDNLHLALRKVDADGRFAGDKFYYQSLLNAVNLRRQKYKKVLNLSQEVFQQAAIQADIFYQVIGWYHNALASLHLDHPQQALEMAEKIKDILNKYGFTKYMKFNLHIRGLVAHARGEYKTAIDFLNRATSLLPSQVGFDMDTMSHARFMESRAETYVKMGEVDKAISEYDNIARLTCGRLFYGDIYARSFFKLGELYQKKKWIGKAIENYQKFLKIWQSADPGIQEVVDARKQLLVLQTGN